MGGGGDVFDVLALEELLKVICDKGRAVVCEDDAGDSVFHDEVL